MSTSIASKVLCVNLKTSCLGTSFVDPTLTANLEHSTGADVGKVKGSKKILGNHLKPVRALLREARTYVNEASLPGISDDLRIVTPKRLAEIREHLADVEARMAKEVAKFSELIAVVPPDGSPPYERSLWAACIEEDRVGLKEAFDPNDYPPLENLPTFFSVRLSVCDLPAGDYLRVEGLTDETIDKLKAEHSQMLERVGAAARNEVHKKLVEMLSRISENLDQEDISRLKSTTFTNLQDYLAKVPDLNITNDPQLEAMRVACTKRLNVSMAAVKASVQLKERAKEAATEILSRFGGGNRKIMLAESPADSTSESVAA
jgi:hypothetical protein